MQTDKVLHGQIWRLFTSQYLHAFPGMTHLLFNMIGLYFLGRALERIWSPRKFFAVYTIAGLCGNLFYVFLGLMGWLATDQPMVGASGCILGLLGICAVLFPRAEVYVYFLFPVKIRTAAIVFAGLYALNLWQRGANAGGDAAHLAGLVFGVWWAARGERWWAISGSRWFGRLIGTSAGPRQPRPTAWQRKMEGRKADAELIDELLAKVYEGGLHSLTPKERKELTEATERARQREKQAGRTDRL
jgi:membrane associated rhomboid family serine protease